MKEETKMLIKNLTQMYIKDKMAEPTKQKEPYIKISAVHRAPKPAEVGATWSADFIEGKGEGLTFLLHGKPGVGKTYTAGTSQLGSDVKAERDGDYMILFD
jgi:hypothetical protein